MAARLLSEPHRCLVAFAEPAETNPIRNEEEENAVCPAGQSY